MNLLFMIGGLALIILLCLFLGRLSNTGPRCIEDAPPGSILVHYGHQNVRYCEVAAEDAGRMSDDDFANEYFLNPEVYKVEVKDEDGNAFTFYPIEEE